MSKMENPKLIPRLVADDNGYASHKVAWYDENGKIRTLKIDSVVSVAASASTDSLGDADGKSYRVDGVVYSCRTNPKNPIDIRTSDYPTSVANRVLLTSAL